MFQSFSRYTKAFIYLLLISLSSFTFAQNPAEFNPKAFISIGFNLGRHNIYFKDFANSPGASFGFNISAGIYAVNKGKYKGGIQFTLLEGASFNKDRRQASEDFDLPNKDFDKHRFFKFAQFRSSNIGWFSELELNDKLTVYHHLGFGIFGTTELDQLYDLGLHNSIGILTGKPDQFRLALGIVHDKQVGTGNPNYTMSNLGFTVGGFRSF